VRKQREGGARIAGMSCPGGKHELDNECEPMGAQVRASAAAFAAYAAAGKPVELPAAPCSAF
jgi:hypothetical protein